VSAADVDLARDAELVYQELGYLGQKEELPVGDQRLLELLTEPLSFQYRLHLVSPIPLRQPSRLPLRAFSAAVASVD
jgi:hypothetical protein